MKKIIFIGLVFFLTILNFQYAEAKKKTYQNGNFRYTYKMEKKGVWITNIKPLSKKGIGTLKIPSQIKGKKVIKLGFDEDFDGYGSDSDYNIFGIRPDPEGNGSRLVPQHRINMVKKIKTIKIPSTVETLGFFCFDFIGDGKTINIPQKVKKYVISQFTKIKWKKITISAKNKKFKVKNGCLLSRDGTVVYGFVQKKKKMVIPETVKTIDTTDWHTQEAGVGDYNGCPTIVIPKSVNKIERYAFSTDEPVAIKIAKGNKRYAVQYDSVYSKVSGRLVLGYINNGVLKVPEKVTNINTDIAGILGKGTKLKKVIMPSGVKKIYNLFGFENCADEFICEIRCRKPPKLTASFYGGRIGSKYTVYVPKNCKNKYVESWKGKFEPILDVKYIEM